MSEAARMPSPGNGQENESESHRAAPGSPTGGRSLYGHKKYKKVLDSEEKTCLDNDMAQSTKEVNIRGEYRSEPNVSWVVFWINDVWMGFMSDAWVNLIDYHGYTIEEADKALAAAWKAAELEAGVVR